MTRTAAIWRDAAFRRSSFSGSSGGNCVEIACAGSLLGVRDSKNIGSMLAVNVMQGRAFLTAIKRERRIGTP
ncbi:MAG TPA: DUF397 domain-containing protein [Actinophytocola sp.]|uniref:DUF397 domain-containing protein n=1 Tax=Actinophytocola sp. TaxID=1872138 RepID=UPI002DBF7731|nr:DUF397 domain-containing protein [Actinophytocola sp.]HEU5476091.1 DUF397 domain-containing protein [Actinophytocola sp.]